MSKRSEKEFEDIGEELDRKTSAVKCSVAEYIDGLRDIRSRIDTAIEAAESNLQRSDGSEEGEEGQDEDE